MPQLPRLWLGSLLPDVPVKPSGNLPQERVEPLAVGYVAGVVPKRALRDVLVQVSRIDVMVRADPRY